MVYTGNRVIVWGGFMNHNRTTPLGDGYYLDGTAWSPMTAPNAPTARAESAFTWTGTQLIIWGGSSNAVNALDTGSVFTPP